MHLRVAAGASDSFILLDCRVFILSGNSVMAWGTKKVSIYSINAFSCRRGRLRAIGVTAQSKRCCPQKIPVWLT